MKPIVVTPGDPAGIGPDILLKIVSRNFSMPMIAVANKNFLMQRASQLNLNIECVDYDEKIHSKHQPNRLPIINVDTDILCEAGIPNPAFSNYLIQTLTIAAKGCLSGRFRGLVTGPVNKEIINEGGIFFTGHTEFLKQLTKAKRSVMMLMTDKMKVALLTTHLPLKKVPFAITEENLINTIKIISKDLTEKFEIKNPCIAVCGVNPHAGEGGHIGDEEQKIMIPTLNQLKQQGFNIKGPLSADTVFTPKILNEVDVVLAMYHDQGLPVLKYHGFDKAVNVTLGLPIIRTSVDHGTAYDIAGTGKANPESLYQAILLASQLTKS